MKQEGIDRLKEMLGDEFEVLNQSHEENNKFFVVIVKKKDILKDHEFVMTETGRICRSKDVGWSVIGNDHLLPSTEAAYVDQLKKESFERYGEIKEGDRFDRSHFKSTNQVCVVYNVNHFSYNKINDSFWVGGQIIYKAGFWAKKLPERVEVKFFTSIGTSNESTNGKYIGGKYEFKFIMKKGEYKNLNHFGEYLAKCLEDKLNNE